MDFTKQYVDMCSKATEIQRLKETSLTFADYCYDGCDIFLGEIMAVTGVDVEISDELGHVWLPRQDQLQDMLNIKNKTDLIVDFCDWCVETDTIMSLEDSFEKLWLAFVMKEKYNKQWIDNNWETI